MKALDVATINVCFIPSLTSEERSMPLNHAPALGSDLHCKLLFIESLSLFPSRGTYRRTKWIKSPSSARERMSAVSSNKTANPHSKLHPCPSYKPCGCHGLFAETLGQGPWHTCGTENSMARVVEETCMSYAICKMQGFLTMVWTMQDIYIYNPDVHPRSSKLIQLGRGRTLKARPTLHMPPHLMFHRTWNISIIYAAPLTHLNMAQSHRMGCRSTCVLGRPILGWSSPSFRCMRLLVARTLVASCYQRWPPTYLRWSPSYLRPWMRYVNCAFGQTFQTLERSTRMLNAAFEDDSLDLFGVLGVPWTRQSKRPATRGRRLFSRIRSVRSSAPSSNYLPS